jgi:hypothetical protein
VRTPDGQPQDVGGVYAADEGKTLVHLRPPLDGPKGPWRIVCREMAAGIKAEATVIVE